MSYSNNKITMERIAFTILFSLALCSCVWTQDTTTDQQPIIVEETRLELKNEVQEDKTPLEVKKIKKQVENDFEPQRETKDLEVKISKDSEVTELKIDEQIEFDKYDFTEDLKKSYIKEKPFFKPPNKTPIEFEPIKHFQKTEKFHWKTAIAESIYFLGIQQSLRTIQKKTRREFGGEFFRDWGVSAGNLGGWRDGDSFMTNYIAHPMQGAVTGRIFINNSERSNKLEFGKSKEYWKSRFKAMAWSAVWSTQFELGPISEASIGNVGLYDRTGPNLMGWVDLVVTPTAGTGVIIGEDIIDKFIIKKWLERGLHPNDTRLKVYRTFFAPFQSFTNVLNGKVPWHRSNR